MNAYYVSFRLGAAVDLQLHNMLVTGETMTDALELFHAKIWRRFPMYQVVTVLPAGGVELPAPLGVRI